MPDTVGGDYTRRLETKEGAWWKRALDVQAPYRWNLRRQDLGRTLDVGCGIGRNLAALDPGSVGVDHNPDSVRVARSRGFTALTVEEWEHSDLRQEGAFDGMLVAHVIEHLDPDAAAGLLRDYLPYVRPGGRVFLVCPQERGYASDETHVSYTDGAALEALARGAGLRTTGWTSFPLPAWAGRAFTYNEFCLAATVA